MNSEDLHAEGRPSKKSILIISSLPSPIFVRSSNISFFNFLLSGAGVEQHVNNKNKTCKCLPNLRQNNNPFAIGISHTEIITRFLKNNNNGLYHFFIFQSPDAKHFLLFSSMVSGSVP